MSLSLYGDEGGMRMITFYYNLPKQEKFVIDNDKKAEWALQKNKREKSRHGAIHSSM